MITSSSTGSASTDLKLGCGVLNRGLDKGTPPLFDFRECTILRDSALGGWVGWKHLPEIRRLILFGFKELNLNTDSTKWKARQLLVSQLDRRGAPKGLCRTFPSPWQCLCEKRQEMRTTRSAPEFRWAGVPDMSKMHIPVLRCRQWNRMWHESFHEDEHFQISSL